MTFNDNLPIYVQIADRLADDIMAGTYAVDERVPGVRELSVDFGVNANTTVKAFDILARQDILYQRRGLGYFVAPAAIAHITQMRKEEFYRQTLPAVFLRMQQLGITVEEFGKAFEKYLAEK